MSWASRFEEGRGAAPFVTGLELFGVDPVTGEPRSEKIAAGK